MKIMPFDALQRIKDSSEISVYLSDANIFAEIRVLIKNKNCVSEAIEEG